MHRCHACGQNIPSGSSVFRVIRTGAYSEGGDYMREVVLCPRCNQNQSTSERNESNKKWVVLAGAVAAAAGLAVYWFFYRGR